MRSVPEAPGFSDVAFGPAAGALQNDLWLCRLKAEPTVAFLSSSDQTSSVYECGRVSDIPSTLKAGYWLYKAFQWIEQVPFP